MMKNLLMFIFSGIVLTAAAGCDTHMKDLLTLPPEGASVTPQTMTVTEKGTYYLYSSKEPKTVLFRKDLKKGDEIGFSVHGDRARATAAGTIIELSDYSEGASYTWKIEVKDKDEKMKE